jgi:hypothetical protein
MLEYLLEAEYAVDDRELEQESTIDVSTDALVTAIERHFNPNNSPQLEQYVTRILDTYSNVFFAWLDEYGVQGALEMILNCEDRTNYLYS